MKIVLASRNKHKIGELQALLSKHVEGIEILSLDDVGIYGEIDENGSDFCENAVIKARAAAASGYIGIGDDSGLSVRALGGEPGIYSARYAGEHGNDAANNKLLLKNLADSEYAEKCVFKGGTSLSKCYPGSIERFSEDIDLTVSIENYSSSQAKRWIVSLRNGML